MPQVGKSLCMPLYCCPQMVDTFANPPKEKEAYLRQFVCKNGRALSVCCGHSNFTILDEQASTQRHMDVSTKVFARHAFPTCYKASLWDYTLPVILVKNIGSDEEVPKCFGALINPRYVITAASCVVWKYQTWKFVVSSIRFVLKGNINYVVAVEEEIPHPFYDPITGLNDLALLRLNETISEDKIEPMCMYKMWSKVIDKDRDIPLITYDALNKSATEKWYESSLLSVSFYLPDEREKTISEVVKNDIVLSKYYIRIEDFTGFCNEYFGVPLFYSRYPPWLIGISSTRIKCGDGLPDTYTNVAPYKEWLTNSMRPWPVNNDQCTTPNGEVGRCMPLDYCPVVLEVFLGATRDTEEYLHKFVCQDTDYLTMFVCCPTLSSSAFENKNENATVKVPLKFLEASRCGMQHRDDYISSDTTVAIDEFPWIALIQQEVEDRYIGRCTGTLINERYVLTAAICTLNLESEYTIVRLGDYSWSNQTDCVVEDEELGWIDCSQTEIYGVEKIVVHPFINEGYYFQQLALLRLNKTVFYTDYIRPICLPVKGIPTAKPDDYLYLSSWGYKEEGSREAIKKKVLTKIIEISECQQSYRRKVLNDPINGFDICSLDDINNTDFVIALDDGGALMMVNNYRWHLEGVLTTSVIGYTLPKLYVNVSRNVNWILANMHPWF